MKIYIKNYKKGNGLFAVTLTENRVSSTLEYTVRRCPLGDFIYVFFFFNSCAVFLPADSREWVIEGIKTSLDG